jgi:hypothetical protein
MVPSRLLVLSYLPSAILNNCQTDAAPFRNASGEPCDGRLVLFISDLLPPSAINTLSPDIATSEHITIPFAGLAAFLADA